MPFSARIQIVDLTTAIGYEMLVMKLNMLQDECYSPQMMPPSAPIQLADLTNEFGYESFVSKLRVLEDEQATAAIIAASIPTPSESADNKSTFGDIDRAGAELRASAGVPALQNLNWQPNQVAPGVSVHDIAKAAYERNSRNTEHVQNLLHILKTGTPALSRTTSQSSESEAAPRKMTIFDIAQSAYKRNSLKTESVHNLLNILNSGVTPSLSRSTSDSSTSSSFESLSEEDFEDFVPMSPTESLSVCLPGCECDVGVWELSAEWECALEDGFESAAKWVDALVSDD